MINFVTGLIIGVCISVVVAVALNENKKLGDSDE